MYYITYLNLVTATYFFVALYQVLIQRNHFEVARMLLFAVGLFKLHFV
jgi:hypothetical protein